MGRMRTPPPQPRSVRPEMVTPSQMYVLTAYCSTPSNWQSLILMSLCVRSGDAECEPIPRGQDVVPAVPLGPKLQPLIRMSWHTVSS